MRVVIAGGGTGGHLFPGIAVAEEFKRRDKDAEVVFMGTEQGIEARVIPQQGYPIRFLRAEGMLGKSVMKKALALFRLLGSIGTSRGILKAVSPDVVVGTGGYVSAAPVISARLGKTPTLIMEQNVVPGLANRVLSRLADAVAVTYHESLPFFPKEKTFLTGNPVRRSVLEGRRDRALELFSLDSDRLTVLISGGSAGARSINSAMVNALSRMLEIKNKVQFLHQTGRGDYEGVRSVYRQMGFRAMVAPFVYDMAEAYSLSDVVISRAGATTIAELTALGRPAIIIPYPHAGGHQEFNAKKLADAGACRVIADRDLTGDKLALHIKELVGDEARRAEMAARSRALGRPDAAERVVDIASSLIKAKGPMKKKGASNV